MEIRVAAYTAETNLGCARSSRICMPNPNSLAFIGLKFPKSHRSYEHASMARSTPCHISLVLRDRFATSSANIVPQTPYSIDLFPCDFWLFAKHRDHSGDRVLGRLRR